VGEMKINLLQKAKKEHAIAEMRKLLPPCPICGKKAYLHHDIVDGFDFGWDAGCPSFCLNDGVHGITKSHDPEAPHINSWSPVLAFEGWLEYCKRKEQKDDTDSADSEIHD